MGTSLLLKCLFFKLCVMLLAIGFATAAPVMTERLAVAVGTAECLDCMQKNIKSEDATEGLNVAVKCKLSNGNYETKATAELEKSGSFKVEIPGELLGEDGEIKDECFLGLHDAFNVPCSDENNLNPSKLVLKSKENGRHTFAAASEKLSFSSATCASAFSWHPFHKHYLPLHKPWHKFPPYTFTHKPYYLPWHKPWHKFPPYTFPHKPYFQPLTYQSQKPPAPEEELPLPVHMKQLTPPASVYKEPLPLTHQLPPFYHPHHKLPPFYHSNPRYELPPLQGWNPIPPSQATTLNEDETVSRTSVNPRP